MSDADRPMMSVRPLRGLAMYVIDEHGVDVLQELASGAGIAPDVLLDPSRWVEMESAAELLRATRASLVPGEEAFQSACSYRFREGFGPVVHVLPVATPRLMFDVACKTIPLFSNVSRGEVIRQSRTQVVMRYYSDAPEVESRELCLSRSAAMVRIPEVFGLPSAIIQESTCIARGDACCEYMCSFQTRARWLPPAIGLVIGGLAAWGAAGTGMQDLVGYVTVPATFALLGLAYELRATSSANAAHGQRIQEALRELAEDEGEARREILAFHQRQKDWGKLMEEQVAERTEQLQELIARIQSMSEARVSTVRGVSHDLRNPVTVVRLNHELLRQRLPDEARLHEALDDSEEALSQMERMLVELTQSAISDGGLVPIKPTEMEIAPWVDVLRRRVKALVYGKDISVSVFRRREAPEQIETDRLVFERVVDNICSNAAKYTERGSIVVELDGKPGFLTLKVSDTGVGIEQDRIARIFEPGQTPDGQRAPRSLGVGLSVVVQLLAQIGGKLEVMSKIDQGTTFWAHFPIELPKPEEQPAAKSRDARLAQVVTIRRALSA